MNYTLIEDIQSNPPNTTDIDNISFNNPSSLPPNSFFSNPIKNHPSFQSQIPSYSNQSQPQQKYSRQSSSSSSNKQEIYDQFVSYFNNLPFYKIEDKGTYSIYMTRITCQLCVLKKYLIVFVPRDNDPQNTQKELKDLKWLCFQAQLSTIVHKLPDLSYSKKNLPFFNTRIHVSERTPQKISYTCKDLPLKVELLPKNTQDKDYNKYEYADEGTLKHAIETFKTIITFTS